MLTANRPPLYADAMTRACHSSQGAEKSARFWDGEIVLPSPGLVAELILDTVDREYAWFAPARPGSLVGRVPIKRAAWDEAKRPGRARLTVELIS